MADITIQVTMDSTVPVYRQVVDQVRMHIASGDLAAGDALPSVRGLAQQLGVHFNTIADSYRELASEGWLDIAHGKRAVVLARNGSPALHRDQAEDLRQRLRALVAEMLLKGVATKIIQADVAEILKERR
jgi:DNA-binding transcriptional regulator YhcF (GntR family)